MHDIHPDDDERSTRSDSWVSIEVLRGAILRLNRGYEALNTGDSSYGKLAWDAGGAPIPFEQSLTILASVVSRPLKERAVLDVGWKSASSASGAPAVHGLPGASFEFAGDGRALVLTWADDRVEIRERHAP